MRLVVSRATPELQFLLGNLLNPDWRAGHDGRVGAFFGLTGWCQKQNIYLLYDIVYGVENKKEFINTIRGHNYCTR